MVSKREGRRNQHPTAAVVGLAYSRTELAVLASEITGKKLTYVDSVITPGQGFTIQRE